MTTRSALRRGWQANIQAPGPSGYPLGPKQRPAGSPHPCRTYGVARPAEMLFGTALGCRSLIRMRPLVQVQPGPLAAMTSGNAGQCVRSLVRRRCAGSRTLTWLPLLVMDRLLQVSVQAVGNGPKRTINDLCGPRQADPCRAAHRGGRDRHGAGGVGRRLRGTGRPRLTPYRRGSTVSERCGSGWAVPPAWWVGRSLATRPRAVRPRGAPEDAPARGDRHRARLGVRQGPQLHLLAEAGRRPSVHASDLRLALPGLPHPRPAVL
jgi:hypothetical protein